MAEQLAELIIRQDFGEKFAAVVSIIQKNQNIKLGELFALSKLSFAMLRHILIILFKHNIIMIQTKTSDIVPSSENSEKLNEYVYNISLTDILQRIRFSKILFHVGTVFGTIGRRIISEFLENGRLNASECLAQIEERQSTEESDDVYNEKEIRKALAALIRANYLQRLETLDSMANQIQEETSYAEENPKKRGKRRGAAAIATVETKPKKKVKKKDDAINMLRKDGLSEKLLNKISGEGNAEENKDGKMEKGHDKDHLLYYDVETGQELVFCVNFRQFIHDFRSQIIAEMVSQKLNNRQGAAILQAIMNESKLLSKAEKFRVTEPLSLGDINQKLNQIATLKDSTTERSLDQLQKEGFIRKVNINEANNGLQFGYCADMNYIVSALKSKTFERIIEAKYSIYHSRIFRLLDKQGYLDPKQVSDLCMISIKEARTKLFELFKDKIVVAQEIQAEKEKFPSFIYGVKLSSSTATLANDILKTIYNLKAKQEIEVESSTSEVGLTKEEFARKRELISKLESAVLELDDDVVLFTEF